MTIDRYGLDRGQGGGRSGLGLALRFLRTRIARTAGAWKTVTDFLLASRRSFFFPFAGNVGQFGLVGYIVFKVAAIGADVAHKRACKSHLAGVDVHTRVMGADFDAVFLLKTFDDWHLGQVPEFI